MQDLSAASGTPAIVDIPRNRAYPRLVTKATTLSEIDPQRTDAADDGTPVEDPIGSATHAGYYEQRRARYIAAIRGLIPVAEYVREAVAEVDSRRQIPPAAFNEH
jgi:hypothetical protein